MSEVKKKILSFAFVLVAVFFLIGSAFVTSAFPISQTDSAVLMGVFAFLVFGVLYKIICDIWR
jgi:ABC-type uncharacterized transport system permease subunit